MSIRTKLPGVGTTIFTIMSQMAQEHGAINLSQGFPDFSVPEGLLELVTKYMKQGYNQYPPMAGVPYLRDQIAAKMEKIYGAKVSAENEITVTSGATEALFVAIQALVHPGDEVIVFDPAYDSYEPAITLAGGKTIHLPLQTPEFNIDWTRVKNTVSKKTRLIIFNSPHNPSGSVFAENDLTEMAEIAEANDLYLLADEVYEHMVFDGLTHQSLLLSPRLRERSLVVSSFGKTYHATGWKIAYCIAPPHLTEEFRKVHQFVTFTSHTPTQWALAEYMESHPEHYMDLATFYQKKRDFFCQQMKDTPFKITPTQGTYFQLADYGAISDITDTEFAEFLTKKVGVAAIPISVFSQQEMNTRLVRFCFAKDEDTLKLAAEKLSRVADYL